MDSATASKVPVKIVAVKEADWGLLEPLRPVFGPVADMLGPFGNITTILTILLLIVSILWLRSPSSNVSNKGTYMTPQRLAAYEEMWRKEESELWNWLDERLKLDEVYTAGRAPAGHSEEVVRGRKYESKMSETPDMSHRHVSEAIKVTEEKLASLKGVVDRKRREAMDEL